MPAFKRDNASRLREAERCMKAGEPLTVREASFISLLMGHTERTGAATVRFTMHVDGSLDGQINIRWVTCARLRSICTHWHLSRARCMGSLLRSHKRLWVHKHIGRTVPHLCDSNTPDRRQ